MLGDLVPAQGGNRLGITEFGDVQRSGIGREALAGREFRARQWGGGWFGVNSKFSLKWEVVADTCARAVAGPAPRSDRVGVGIQSGDNDCPKAAGNVVQALAIGESLRDDEVHQRPPFAVVLIGLPGHRFNVVPEVVEVGTAVRQFGGIALGAEDVLDASFGHGGVALLLIVV